MQRATGLPVDRTGQSEHVTQSARCMALYMTAEYLRAVFCELPVRHTKIKKKEMPQHTTEKIYKENKTARHKIECSLLLVTKRAVNYF